MFDCSDVAATLAAQSSDPRVTDDALRCIPGPAGAGTVLLVGVVHDHPASIGRVTGILEALSPDLLALELPPLAVPLFRLYARAAETPPRLGGEMSAAVQAAGDVETVGIDGPNRPYLRRLARLLVDGDPTAKLVRAVVEDVIQSTAHAVACRIGAVLGAVTPLRLRLYSHIEYDTTVIDSPAEQATQEKAYLSQQRAFLRAVTTPESIRTIDRAREESMIALLRKRRSDGDVIAVVGMEHLDALERGLATSA